MADLKSRIISHLEKRGTYDPSVDDDMVDELIAQSHFAKKIFKTLLDEGAVIYYTAGNGARMSRMNPLMNAYQMTMRNVYQMATKLGINRSDRLKLKIIEQKQADELDALLNEDK